MSQSRIKIQPEKVNKANSHRPKYWMAVGTLAAYSTFGTNAVKRVSAQDRNPAVSGTPSGQTNGMVVRRFEIPSGNLGEVLPLFEKTVGFTVIVPDDSVRAIWSSGAVGLLSPEAGLQKILAGTGLGYKVTAPTSITLQVQGLSTTVEVTDTTLQDTLPKYTQPLVETPQSIDVVPQHIIQDQGATTLRDTLRNVAGISLAAGEGGAQGDSLTIRGFTVKRFLAWRSLRQAASS